MKMTFHYAISTMVNLRVTFLAKKKMKKIAKWHFFQYIRQGETGDTWRTKPQLKCDDVISKMNELTSNHLHIQQLGWFVHCFVGCITQRMNYWTYLRLAAASMVTGDVSWHEEIVLVRRIISAMDKSNYGFNRSNRMREEEERVSSKNRNK